MPPLKKKRFNEEALSQISKSSKRLKLKQLKVKEFMKVQEKSMPQLPKHIKGNKDASKNELINSIQHMSDEEVTAMMNALKTVAVPVNGANESLTRDGLKTLAEVNGDDFSERGDEDGEGEQEVEDYEYAQEVEDKVDPLPEKSHRSKSHSKISSYKSRVSTQYINDLKSQIEDEKQARLEMERQIEEIKRMNKELLYQVKHTKN